ncbi:helix-hairpin-helix domain-containing protein [Mycobacterium sp. SMC-17]|uniref:helix-hairpin-helix domain-containing protein n=1 Tax=Mycobacterium sp. SMC-17 TaxID=3381628 RepID=UPI0038776E29
MWPTADVRLGELVAGLDALGAQPIPYGTLPARAQSAYKHTYVTWSDIADATVGDLLRHRSIGVRTVESIVMAARAAVKQHEDAADPPMATAAEAVNRLLERLDWRNRKVLLAREWAPKKVTQDRLATEIGVHPTWLWRNESRIRSRFAESLGEPAHSQVRQSAEALGRRLGIYVPRSTVDSEIRQLGLEPMTEPAWLLLYVAGPYRERDGWFENVSHDGRRRVDTAVRERYLAEPAPTLGELTTVLTAAGVRGDAVPAYLDPLPLREIGGVYVRSSAGLSDKVAAVLHSNSEPMTAEEICAVVGDETSARAVLKALHGKATFVRTSRTRWTLASRNVPAYGGIAQELISRIEAAGGRSPVRTLLDDMVDAFPDIKESSIRTYLATLAFVVEDGEVRRRRPDDPWPNIPSLHTVPGASRQSDGCVRVEIPVTAQVLRGSGLSIEPAVAEAIGILPGHCRDFKTADGVVPIAWDLSEPAAPNMGSVRTLAHSAGAQLGDSLVLVFDPDGGALRVAGVRNR